MIPDETPPLRPKGETPIAELEAGNDNGGMGATTIDPRILVVARAIGRQIAREQLRDCQAANNNGPEDEC